MPTRMVSPALMALRSGSRRIWAWEVSAVCACAALVISGCASTGGDLPAAPATAASAAYNYIVGPGDTLQISVWRNPELSSTVPVRPDGKVSTPLVDELVAVGAGEVREALAGVHFSGSLETGYRACLWSRLASRVLLRLRHFEALNEDALYAGIQGIDWSEHLGSDARI